MRCSESVCVNCWASSEISPDLGRLAFRIQSSLRAPDCGDGGPHERAVDEVVAQHGQAGIIAGALEIAVQQAPREVGSAAVREVHYDEGDLAHHVDPAQARIELDAVEDEHAPAMERHVPEVQIAVALAHETFHAARFEGWDETPVLGFAPVAEPLERRAHAGLHEPPRQRSEVVSHRPAHCVRSTVAVDRGVARAIRVKRRDRVRDLIGNRRCDRPGRQQSRELRPTLELAHPDRPLHRFARTADHGRVHLTLDRYDIEVKSGASRRLSLTSSRQKCSR